MIFGVVQVGQIASKVGMYVHYSAGGSLRHGGLFLERDFGQEQVA